MPSALGLNSYSPQQYAFLAFGVSKSATVTTGTNATLSIATTTTAQPPTQVTIYNGSTSVVFVSFGNSTVTTSLTSGMPIPVQVSTVVFIPTFSLRGATHVCIAAPVGGGTVTAAGITFTTGEGRA